MYIRRPGVRALDGNNAGQNNTVNLVWKARGGLIHISDFDCFLVPVGAETPTKMNTFPNCILAHAFPVTAGFRKCARRKKKSFILSKVFFLSFFFFPLKEPPGHC